MRFRFLGLGKLHSLLIFCSLNILVSHSLQAFRLDDRTSAAEDLVKADIRLE